MATILCNNPDCLMVVLFGQKLRFTRVGSEITCVAKQNPFPDVTEDPAAWINKVHQATAWFHGASPRSTLTLSPCFGQTIRLREPTPGNLVCEALHDGAPGAVEVPVQLEAVLGVIEAWFAA